MNSMQLIMQKKDGGLKTIQKIERSVGKEKMGIYGAVDWQVHNNFKRKMYTRSGKFKQIPNEDELKHYVDEGRKGIRYLLEDKTYFKWTEAQNRQYAQFLSMNISEFAGNRKRRSMNFFTRMSDTLKIRRTNEQCRSHHQKMEKKYGSVQAIIQKFLICSDEKVKEQTVFQQEKTQYSPDAQNFDIENYLFFDQFPPIKLPITEVKLELVLVEEENVQKSQELFEDEKFNIDKYIY